MIIAHQIALTRTRLFYGARKGGLALGLLGGLGRAAISAMVPVGLAIGLPHGYLVAFAAARYGCYILLTYPSDLAALHFDRLDTTPTG